MPVISSDGGFVLFSSTADNLIVTSNNTPLAGRFPSPLNVFVRDRTNKVTTLVSANITGDAGGNGDSTPLQLSAGGRYVLFESSASDLVPGDTNGVADIFVRDLSSNNIVLVSISTTGWLGNDESRNAVMTPDGRFVAFVSAASSLVAGDTNTIPDVFVRDLQAGTTALVSVGAQQRSPSTTIGMFSEYPQISSDGRYVAFYSTAAGLFPNVPANGDLYVRDLVAGTTTWVSAGARAATQAVLKSTNVVCYNYALSSDGHVLAYESSPISGIITAGIIVRYDLRTGVTEVVHNNGAVTVAPYEEVDNLDMTPDGRFIAFIANTNDMTGATTCVCVWDAQTRAITLASGDSSNRVAAGAFCDWPKIDASGRFVTFLSSAANLATNTISGQYHLYLRDLDAKVTILLDMGPNGAESVISPASSPSLANNGILVAFEGADGQMVPDDRNRCYDVFVRDCDAGRTELISAHHPSLASRSPNGPSRLAPNALSDDGRWVVFSNESDNLVANDTNQCRDIFVRDLATGTLLLVSVNTNGICGNSVSSEPAISPDGRFVVFTSSADDLKPGDTNRASDVFLRDLQNGETSLVSVNRSGTGPGNLASYTPTVGIGGRYVVFRSKATTLVNASVTSGENLYVRDTLMQTNGAITTTGLGLVAMSADGRFVVYTAAGPLNPLAVWDTKLGKRIDNKNLTVRGSVLNLAVAPDGRRIAYTIQGGLYVVELSSGASLALDTSGSPACNYLTFSGDGQFLAYTRSTPTSPVGQMYLAALNTGVLTLVSTEVGGDVPGNVRSDSPALSADGRFLAYRSRATNIVPGDTNEVPDIFLYDRRTGVNTLLSCSQVGGAANNRSLVPVFSGDGSTLIFASWASDLANGDFNQRSDLFGFTFLSAIILPSESPDGGARLSWPWVPGNNYRVEYKDTLSDSSWQPLSGTITNVGSKAWMWDSAPNSQRIYRVVSF
jgi:Tol biopolymer transport system component